MRVLTVLGTRPEIIRLSLIIKKLDKYCDHTLVHTGQNYDYQLNEVFFNDLGIRPPDYFLGVKSENFAEQIGKILIESEKVIKKVKPERILILGDTNSGLVSFIAKRMGIAIFHMEAGNRCFNDRVPEEVNRKVIDHSSTILLPYTHNSKENLLREGIAINRIFITGNPIFEVLEAYKSKIKSSKIFDNLKIDKQKYFLVTMHREENVDDKERLSSILEALDMLSDEYEFPIICSLHPRTRNKMEKFNLKVKNNRIKFLEPLGFFDFVFLEKNAFCVISDSGTVQEESCIFKVPNITIRDVTERPETIECGSNMLTGIDSKMIVQSVKLVLSEQVNWNVPDEYIKNNVSATVIKIILGYNDQKIGKLKDLL
ncbi:MAG: UDP-N-acetylglucosamine 2-epimerase (non-hydrolyzing) [bacterium]|nr:UDP-N-acetylglucosamine 2-epimerase (non-hydrolyzing) [bacterium]